MVAGLLVGGGDAWLAVVVVDPVIMQLKFLESLLFMLLVVPQIQFNVRAPDSCMQSVHGYVVTSSSSSLSSWVQLCRKPSNFHKRSSGVFFVRNAWFDSGYMLRDSSRVLTHLLREGRTSDLEVDFVLLSGVSWYGAVCTVDAPRWMHVEIWTQQS